MHEAGLLAAAVAAVSAAAGNRPLVRVELAIGTGVDPDAAAQAWRQAAAGGPAEHATVDWTVASDTLACIECGAEYSGDPLTVCPRCGGNGLVIRPAHELEIVGWELSSAPDPPPRELRPGEGTPSRPDPVP